VTPRLRNRIRTLTAAYHGAWILESSGSPVGMALDERSTEVKEFLKRRWVVPASALILALSIGSAAFAATGSSSTNTTAAVTNAATTATTEAGTAATGTTTAGANTATTSETSAAASTGKSATKATGAQRTDETLLTGTELTKVQEAALAKVGSDATVLRCETDADGNAKYEAHMQKADGTQVTVYMDESFNVVSVDTQQAGGHRGGHGAASTDSTSGGSTSTTTSGTSGS
jgi:hypothetical protein